MSLRKTAVPSLSGLTLAMLPLLASAQFGGEGIGGPVDVRGNVNANVVGQVQVAGKIDVGTVDNNTDVKALVAGYGVPAWSAYKHMKSPSVALSALSFLSFGLTQTNSNRVGVPYLMNTQSSDLMKFLLTKEKTDRFGNNSTARISRLAYCIPGSDSYGKFAPKDPCRSINVYAQTSQNLAGTSNYPLNAAFSAETLLEPLAYTYLAKDKSDKTVSQPALDFITFISGLTKPVDLPSVLTASSGKVDSSKITERETRDQLLQLRSLAASYSMGLYVFNKMYAERLPTVRNEQKISGKTQEIVPGGGKMVSARQVEHYIATRRITDQKWRDGINQSDPIALQREIVFAMADQLHESYLLRQSIDRMAAISATMQLKMNSAERANVEATSKAQKQQAEQDKASERGVSIPN